MDIWNAAQDTLVILLLVCVPSEELRLQTSAPAQGDGNVFPSFRTPGLPDAAASLGWLLASPLLSGSLSAAAAGAGIARRPHLPRPLARIARPGAGALGERCPCPSAA